MDFDDIAIGIEETDLPPSRNRSVAPISIGHALGLKERFEVVNIIRAIGDMALRDWIDNMARPKTSQQIFLRQVHLNMPSDTNATSPA